MSRPSPLAPGFPVLVTGASGFVGGHVARALAGQGYRVRGLCRRPPQVEPGDPEIEWLTGDLREAAVRARAVDGVLGVVHCAGWVSLGADRLGESQAINLDATRDLLHEARAAGVGRFVYTSTLWTVAAGTPGRPACEQSAWNLERVRSPYCDTKRAAERLVLEAAAPGFATCALCPGVVIGPRDPGPSSTRLLRAIVRAPVAVLPRGGLPVVDARVAALAHLRALERAQPGERYVLAGPYLSYLDLAAVLRRLTGRPWLAVPVPDWLEPPLTLGARWLARLPLVPPDHCSPALVAGGFLRLHVSGARADEVFELTHPPVEETIASALGPLEPAPAVHRIGLSSAPGGP